MTEVREFLTEQFEKEKTGELLKDAELCEELADDNFEWYPAEAIYWRKKAIEIRESVIGKNKPELTPYYDKIAEYYLVTGNKTGLKWCEKSKKIKLKAAGKETMDYAHSLRLEASLHKGIMEDGKCKEHRGYALECEKEALAIIEQICGVESKETLESYLEIGKTYYFIYKNIEEAKKCADLAERIVLKYYGEKSIEAGSAYELKARSYYGEGVNEEKLQLLGKALMICYGIEREASGKATMRIYQQIWAGWDHDDPREFLAKRNDVLVNALCWLKDNGAETFVREAISRYYLKEENIQRSVYPEGFIPVLFEQDEDEFVIEPK